MKIALHAAAALMAGQAIGIITADEARRATIERERVGPPPEPRITRTRQAPAARDPNHPAVIEAQRRQARKAQRQAKGFVTPKARTDG